MELILETPVILDTDICKCHTIEGLIKLAEQTFQNGEYDLYYKVYDVLQKFGVKHFWHIESYVFFAWSHPELSRIHDDYYYFLLRISGFTASGAIFCGERRRAARIRFSDLFSVKLHAQTEERNYLTQTVKWALNGYICFEIVRTVSDKELEIRAFHVSSAREICENEVINRYIYKSNPKAKIITIRKRRDGNYGRGKNIYVLSDKKLTVSLAPIGLR